MSNGKVGAPKGGRVHWFLLELPDDVARAYKFYYEYLYHNYAMIRYREKDEKKGAIDEFIVIRTCSRAFRIMYHNFETNDFKYFTAAKPKEAARRVEEIYRAAVERENGGP